MTRTYKWSAVSDPTDFSTPFIEMPAKVVALETINGEVWAVLEGGATVQISDMLKNRAAGTLQ